MASESSKPKGLSLFEKYLSLWVILCIVAGVVLGKVAPGAAGFLDGLAIYVADAPVVSIPIAVCLFFMMYPIMVKICLGTRLAWRGGGAVSDRLIGSPRRSLA